MPALDGNRTADRSLSEAIVDGTCTTTITSLYRRAVFRLVNPLTRTDKFEVRACDRGSGYHGHASRSYTTNLQEVAGHPLSSLLDAEFV